MILRFFWCESPCFVLFIDNWVRLAGWVLHCRPGGLADAPSSFQREERAACPLVSSLEQSPGRLMAFPHALPALSAAFLSHSEETDVCLRKAGDAGQGPTVWGWARALGRTIVHISTHQATAVWCSGGLSFL